MIEEVRTVREAGFRLPKIIYQPPAARTLVSCCQQDKSEGIGLTAMRERGLKLRTFYSIYPPTGCMSKPDIKKII